MMRSKSTFNFTQLKWKKKISMLNYIVHILVELNTITMSVIMHKTTKVLNALRSKSFTEQGITSGVSPMNFEKQKLPNVTPCLLKHSLSNWIGINHKRRK